MAAMMSVTSACSARPTSGVAAPVGILRQRHGFQLRVVSNSRAERGSLVVQMAASRGSRDLSMLKGMLDKEETLLVAGFRYEASRYVCASTHRHFRAAKDLVSHPGGEPSPDALPPPRLVLVTRR